MSKHLCTDCFNKICTARNSGKFGKVISCSKFMYKLYTSTQKPAPGNDAEEDQEQDD